MGHLNVFVFAFALVIAVTQALQCFECDNAVSDEDCRNRGRLVECESNQQRCFTETRLVSGDNSTLKISITRRCKQALACENNHIQNPRDAYIPSQCNHFQGSVCRCCCDTDTCNGYEISACGLAAPLEDFQPDPVTCQRPVTPMNGKKQCSSPFLEELSECRFACDAGYVLEGEKTIFCMSVQNTDDVAWTAPSPTCRPIQCPIPKVLRRVVRKCTKQNDYSSQCQFQCEHKLYTANPGDVMDNHCQVDGTWSSPPPCCRLACPPHTIMDLYIVLDSSSSVKSKNWNKTVEFVGGIISKMSLNKGQSQVSVIRYNEHVDEEHQLFLHEGQTETQIRKALATIPYNGVGTKTGKALKYVRHNLLKRPTNRQSITDVVLLLTDGRASDDVATISQQLRHDGVEMFAIGVGKANKKQLLEITGSKAKLWAEMNNYDALTDDAASRIGQTICEKSCL